MGRYAGQKRRATKSETYAFGKEYELVLQKAKKLHRQDNEFYIDKVLESYTSISSNDIDTYNYDVNRLEHWKFIGNRWQKQNKEDVENRMVITRSVNGVEMEFELTNDEIKQIRNQLTIEFASNVISNYSEEIVNYEQESKNREKLLMFGLLIEQKGLENNSDKEAEAIEEVFETVKYS